MKRFLRNPARKLAARIGLAFFVVLVVVVGTASAWSFQSAKQALLDSTWGELSAVAGLKEDELNRWVRGQGSIIEAAAGTFGVGLPTDGSQPAPHELAAVLSAVAASTEELAEVFLLSAIGGRVIASTRPRHQGAFYTDSPFFLEGRFGLAVQNVYVGPHNGAPTLSVAAPVHTREGELAYVLAAHLELARAGGLTELGGASPLPGSRAYLVTPELDLVSSDRLGLDEYDRGVRSQGILAAVDGLTGTDRYIDYRGVPVLGAYRWIADRELALVVEIPEETAFASLDVLLLKILGLGLLITIPGLLLSRLFATTITRRVYAVADAAAMVAEGDFDVVAPVRGDDEVADLAKSFNAMTVQLKTVYADLEGQVSATTDALTKLEKNQSLLHAIVDNSTALIAVADQDGHLVVANEPLLRLLGVGSRDASGRKLDELLPPPLAVQWSPARMAVSETGEIGQLEVTWPETDRTYHSVWFPLKDEESGVFGTGLIATDLTERKRAETEKTRIEAQLRHTQKLESLGVLAGGIAHDFNNILAAILGHADLAAECLEAEPEEVQEHLDQVVAASQRAAELTNQMLAYAGRASFRVETVELNEAIAKMSELVTVSLPKKVSLRTDFHEGALPVRADPAQISQIVMNLITNAAQAMQGEAGTVTITTHEQPVRGGGSAAVLRVMDSGCGMTPRMIERIFDPFFTTKETGRGLGLAAVNGIVTGLGGSIDVASKRHVGTTFTVSLPLAGTSPEAVEADTEAMQDAGRNATILVVDDEDSVRRVAARALQRAGCTVVEAANGFEALEVFERKSDGIDAIVLDLSMPGMGGREVYEKVHALDPTVPVLFTSGYDADDAAGDMLHVDTVQYLQKPYRPVALCQAVTALLNARDRAASLTA